MDILPKIIPISEIRQRQNEILTQLSEGYVVLTQHGKAAAVLVEPAQWNRLLRYVEDLEDALDALQVELAVATGEDEDIDVDVDELRRWAGEPISAEVAPPDQA